MNRAALTTALLLATGLVQAHSTDKDSHSSCDVSSDYSVSTYRSAFVFSQEKRKPAEIGIGGGRLFIDGKEATLTAADHARLSEMEGEMKLLIPEVREVTTEAVDIAFTALTEVARALASNPKATVAKLETEHARVLREINAKPLALFNDDAMEDVVEPIISEYVPEIVGGAVSSALKAVFGGEKRAREFEARMERMEKETRHQRGRPGQGPGAACRSHVPTPPPHRRSRQRARVPSAQRQAPAVAAYRPAQEN